MQIKKKKQEAPQEGILFSSLLTLETFIVDTLVHIKKRKNNEDPKPTDYFEEGEMEAIPMILDTIIDISSVRLNLPDDLTRLENKLLVKETMKEVLKSFAGELPMIDPLKDMHIQDETLVKASEKIKKLEEARKQIENRGGNKDFITVRIFFFKKIGRNI